MRNNAKKGFTLVELIVAIAIMAILTGVLVASFLYVQSKNRNSIAETYLNNVGELAVMTVEEPQCMDEFGSLVSTPGELSISFDIGKKGVASVSTCFLNGDRTVLGANTRIVKSLILKLENGEMRIPSLQYVGQTVTFTLHVANGKASYTWSAEGGE